MYWKKFLLLGVLLLFVSPAQASSIVVNHTNWNWFAAQDQTVFDRLGSQSLFFSHASVGSNIIAGLESLQGKNSDAFQLKITSSGGTPPSAIQDGTLYEYGRGNPGWQAKMNNFDTYIANGWSGVDFAMDKLCYIDEHANAGTYLSKMSALESSNPATRFVYWTMPLTTSNGSDNFLRNAYNSAIRDYALTHDILLFDIADIEAWSDGGESTFVYSGSSYQMLYSGYTNDGGHLNLTGSERVGMALYSLVGMATTPVPVPSALWLLGSALVGFLGLKKRYA